MAIIQIKSTNPDLSWILEKNPETRMLVREIKKGKLFGWFSNTQTYNAYFKDADDEVSFKGSSEEEFEYLNLTRYNSSFFILCVIDELFKSAWKKKNEKDVEGYENQLFINMLNIRNRRNLNMFQVHFPDFVLEEKELCKSNISLTIKTKRSISELLQFTMLLALFNGMMNDEEIYVDDTLALKYAEIMNNIKAPYFIRYLFNSRFVVTKDLYKKILPTLQGEGMTIKYGGNGIARRNELEKIFSFTDNIVDIGCGEGYYAFPWSAKIKDKQYVAIDADEETLQKTIKKAGLKEITNMSFYSSIESFLEVDDLDSYDVVMTEVFEHVELKKALKMIQLVLSAKKVGTFVVTTPNKDFNVHYQIEGPRRHDHIFEMGENEFKSSISKLKLGSYEAEFIQIGDIVNGSSTTQGVVFKKKELKVKEEKEILTLEN